GQSYSPKVKYYSAGQIKGNTEDARWSVYVFNNANVTSGQYTFDVEGTGGGHDIKGQPLTIAIPKTDVIATKVWEGKIPGETARPTVYFKLFRTTSETSETIDPVAVEGAEIKAIPDGKSTATWEQMPLTNESGVNYIYSV